MRNKQKGNVLAGGIAFIFAAFIAIAAVIGYVLNIAKLFQINSIDGHLGEIVIRVFGIFTGVIGAVAGYF